LRSFRFPYWIFYDAFFLWLHTKSNPENKVTSQPSLYQDGLFHVFTTYSIHYFGIELPIKYQGIADELSGITHFINRFSGYLFRRIAAVNRS
jgi:hypothetical protein